MSDTLVIFGTTFPGANGFKATDNNGTVQTYVKNGSGGGGAISIVDTIDANGGTIRTITGVSLAGDTVTAAHLESGYTAHDASGNPITGTLSPGTGEDMPTFTATYSGSTVTAVTCDKTFAECYSYIYDDEIASAKITITDGQYSYDTYVEYISISSSSIVYSGLLSEDGIPMLKITYPSSGSITYSYNWLSKKTSSDLNISGATVTAPTGYYLSNASVTVASGSVTSPSTISDTGASITTGSGTLTLSKTVSVTPTVTTSGYVTSGTAGNSSVSLTASVAIDPTLTVYGSTVTAPAGYYSTDAGASVGTMTLPTSASASASSGYTSKATISRSTSDQYINIPIGYNGAGAYYKVSAVANGTEGTPTATKGTVSNHQILVTPSVTNTAGYISGSTKTGTPVTVSVGELVSGTKSITQNGASILVAEYEYVDVAVPTGTSKNFQVSNTQVRINNKTALTDTGLTLTVAETGTYNVYWSAFRTNSSSGYTWGTQLYIGSSSYGSENTSWSNSYNQVNKLTNVSLTKDQVLHVYGRTRSGNSYYICCSNLILEQTS